jgi:ligand-binding sensor domain-containing protein
VFGDGTWRCFGEQDGLPSNRVRRIVPAPDGSLWIGTDAGVSRMSPEGAAQR